MDEEDDHEFSKEIVFNYFDQAEDTFRQMDDAFRKGDLTKLSELGHFLKGSSAACGVIKVRDSCERIQHYGRLKDARAAADLTREDAIVKLQSSLADVKAQYSEAETVLKKFYADEEDDEEASE